MAYSSLEKAQITLYTILLISGFITNTLIITVIIVSKLFRDKNYIFLLSLAVIDWLIMVVQVPELIANNILDKPSAQGELCRVKGYFQTAFVICSIYHLPTIALHRYFCVVRRNFYNKCFSNKTCIIMCVLCWIISFLYVLPAYLGWGVIGYEASRKQCAVIWAESRSYTIFINTTCYPLPIGVMVFCYMKLILFHRHARDQLRKQSACDQPTSLKITNRERKLTSMLLIVVAGFFAAWFIYTLAMYFEAFTDIRFPNGVNFAANFMGYTNSAVNFWVYAMMSSTFRRGLKKICSRERRHRISDITTSTNISVIRGIVLVHNGLNEEM